MSESIKLSSPETGGFWEIEVLFEDADILALNKPPGLRSAPDPGDPAQLSLLNLLHLGIEQGKPWAKVRGLKYLTLVSKMEAEISGVLLVARNNSAQTKLADFFGSEKPFQNHLALVAGEPTEDEFSTDAKIGPDPAGLMRVDSRNGKRSRTVFTVRERFQGWTLLTCQPLTNRPYQVRAHLKYLRLPVAGDSLYGGKSLLLSRLKPDFRLKPNKTERPLISVPALHVEELAIPHPVTGAALSIKAAWPKDLEVAVKYLRRYAKAG